MLDEYKTPTNYWVEAVHTACHAINRLCLHKLRDKTAYELLTGKKPTVNYFRVFGSKCFILNKKSKSLKFALMVDEGFMLGYGTNEHGYHVFNKTIGLIEIAVDVTFDETDGSQKEQVNVEIVGNEPPSHEAIKKLAIGEVKPVEDEEEDHGVHIDHHVSSNEHGEASSSRSGTQGKSNEDGGNNVQAQPQLNNEESSEDNPPQDHGCDPTIDHDYDDEDDGPIQKTTQVPHPKDDEDDAPRLVPALHAWPLAHVAKSHEFQYLPTHPSSLLTISSIVGELFFFFYFASLFQSTYFSEPYLISCALKLFIKSLV
jgi:hypothetical protein